MRHFTATIIHHSISRAREYKIVSHSLTQARRIASREFGEGYLDHTIQVYEETPMGRLPVGQRKIGERRWRDQY